MIVEAQGSQLELDEAGIPPKLLPVARLWFTNRVRELAHVHGEGWTAHRWLVRQLQAELREHIARKAVRG